MRGAVHILLYWCTLNMTRRDASRIHISFAALHCKFFTAIWYKLPFSRDRNNRMLCIIKKIFTWQSSDEASRRPRIISKESARQIIHCGFFFHSFSSNFLCVVSFLFVYLFESEPKRARVRSKYYVERARYRVLYSLYYKLLWQRADEVKRSLKAHMRWCVFMVASCLIIHAFRFHQIKRCSRAAVSVCVRLIVRVLVFYFIFFLLFFGVVKYFWFAYTGYIMRTHAFKKEEEQTALYISFLVVYRIFFSSL